MQKGTSLQNKVNWLIRFDERQLGFAFLLGEIFLSVTIGLGLR